MENGLPIMFTGWPSLNRILALSGWMTRLRTMIRLKNMSVVGIMMRRVILTSGRLFLLRQ
jgi:hypothetical protein